MSERSRIKLSRVTPVVDTTVAYAANDRVGSILTFTGILDLERRGLVQSVTIINEAGGTWPGFNLLLFRSLPTVASVDNAALDISDAEMTAKYLGHVTLPNTAETVIVSISASNHGTVRSQELAVDSTDGNLYGVIESLGAITFAQTDDLTVVLGVEIV